MMVKTYVLKGKVMIIEYLEKLHHEMYESKLNFETECHKKEVLLDDNSKFIQALENSLDENFESFSPRDVDFESHLKIESLLKEQKKTEAEIEELEAEIAKLNTHLAELEHVLKTARENEKSSLMKETLKEKTEVDHWSFLEMQEREHQYLAKKMHDFALQSFTNLIHKIEICTKFIDVDTVRSRLELHAVSKQIRDIIQDTRDVIYELCPMALDDIHLGYAIEKEIVILRKSEILNVSYETLGEPIELPPIMSLTILRIVQEACHNILEHANAKHVLVQVKYEGSSIGIIIEDDGDGFIINDIQNLKRKDGSGLGIPMMQERICLFSGRLDIDSEPGKGTRIVMKIPIDKEDE